MAKHKDSDYFSIDVPQGTKHRRVDTEGHPKSCLDCSEFKEECPHGFTWLDNDCCFLTSFITLCSELEEISQD